jgi:DNA topoisomerase VI subunit B
VPFKISDIVDNSIDADAQNIWVTVERAGRADWVIEITDDGVGMDEYVLG